MRAFRTLDRWLLGAAAGTTALAVVLLQQLGQLRAGRDPLLFLRTEFWHDQLGYLAIAADVATGHFDNSEPVTTTGVSHYPRLYYSFVGIVARLLGLPTVVAWNLTSFALQFLAALVLSLVAAGLARRWWVAFAGALPFFTGTFAYLIAGTENAWYTHLAAHAVLWGPYGVLFSNNAETAGLCVGIMALGALVWAWRGGAPRRTRIALTIAASAAVGMLSSFQTYSFLTLSYLLVFGAAIAGIMAAGRRAATMVVSVLLVVAVFALGPLAADRLGQLPTLVLGMAPAVPGLVMAIARTRGLVAVAAGAAAATAIPQVLYTLLGIVGDDPFLNYRVASNHMLGIVSWQAVAGAAVVITALVGVLITASIVRDRLALVLSITMLTALPLLAVNDVWGANAEPYRFWIEAILLGSVGAILGMARLFGSVRAESLRATPHDGDPNTRRPLHRRAAIALSATVIVSGVLWVGALPDWVNSLRDDEMQAVWDPATEREAAIAELADAARSAEEGGLLTTERCIDNRTAKVNSGAPIANYHLGMAWPENRESIDAIIDARDAGRLDLAAMEESGTRWVLTDSSCDSDWEHQYAGELTSVESVAYRLEPGEVISAGVQQNGTITLWRVSD